VEEGGHCFICGIVSVYGWKNWTKPRKPCQSGGSCGLNRGTCEYEAGVVVVVVVVVRCDVWRMNAEQFTKIPKQAGNLHVEVFFHHEAGENSQDHENCQSAVLAKIRGEQ
jgi:hypothetical protein